MVKLHNIKLWTTQAAYAKIIIAAPQPICGCSSMAEHQLPKLIARVRFPSPAPISYYALIAQQAERIHGKDEVISSILIEGSKRDRE